MTEFLCNLLQSKSMNYFATISIQSDRKTGNFGTPSKNIRNLSKKKQLIEKNRIITSCHLRDGNLN